MSDSICPKCGQSLAVTHVCVDTTAAGITWFPFASQPVTGAATTFRIGRPTTERKDFMGNRTYTCGPCFERTMTATFPSGVIEEYTPPRHAPAPDERCCVCGGSV